MREAGPRHFDESAIRRYLELPDEHAAMLLDLVRRSAGKKNRAGYVYSALKAKGLVRDAAAEVREIARRAEAKPGKPLLQVVSERRARVVARAPTIPRSFGAGGGLRGSEWAEVMRVAQDAGLSQATRDRLLAFPGDDIDVVGLVRGKDEAAIVVALDAHVSGSAGGGAR